jgi:hypothetical protein
MEQTKYEREIVLQGTAELPQPTSHEGFHKLAGKWIFFGMMNVSEFVEHRRRQYADEDTLPLNQFREKAPLDLHIDIEMKCPQELAPIVHLEKCNLNNNETLCNHIIEPMDPALLQRSQSSFFFKMDVCGTDKYELAKASSVQFEIKSSDFGNANNFCTQERGLFLQTCLDAVRVFLFSPLLAVWAFLGLKTTSR